MTRECKNYKGRIADNRSTQSYIPTCSKLNQTGLSTEGTGFYKQKLICEEEEEEQQQQRRQRRRLNKPGLSTEGTEIHKQKLICRGKKKKNSELYYTRIRF